MKVLLADENRGDGGAERFTRTLGQELWRRGHEVAVLCREGSWLQRECGLPVESAPFSPEWDPRTVARFVSLGRRFDVVHCQANRDLIAASLARRCGMRSRLVKTEHSFLDPARSPLINRAYRDCPCWVAVSRAVAQQMSFNPRTRVIHNGVRLAQTGPPPERMREGLWLVCVGSLIPGKGQRTLLEAMRQLPNARLALVGDGPLRGELEGMADERVWWVGRVEDSLPYVSGACVAVVPTERETFSLACLEAMALGKPVVASDTGGLPELIQDGRSGLLVPPGDASALACALGELLNDRARRDELGAAAAERAREQFSLDRMVEAYEAAYGV